MGQVDPFFCHFGYAKRIRKAMMAVKLLGLLAVNQLPLFAATHGGQLPDTDAGYLISVIVGVLLLVGGIILLRLQKNL